MEKCNLNTLVAVCKGMWLLVDSRLTFIMAVKWLLLLFWMLTGQGTFVKTVKQMMHF